MRLLCFSKLRPSFFSNVFIEGEFEDGLFDQNSCLRFESMTSAFGSPIDLLSYQAWCCNFARSWVFLLKPVDFNLVRFGRLANQSQLFGRAKGLSAPREPLMRFWLVPASDTRQFRAYVSILFHQNYVIFRRAKGWFFSVNFVVSEVYSWYSKIVKFVWNAWFLWFYNLRLVSAVHNFQVIFTIISRFFQLECHGGIVDGITDTYGDSF